MERSGVKNPENSRKVSAAVTLWIPSGVYPERSRRTQNDELSFELDYL